MNAVSYWSLERGWFYYAGDNGKVFYISKEDIKDTKGQATEDSVETGDIKSIISKYIGLDFPKHGANQSELEILNQYSKEECLQINKSRDGFETTDGKPVSVGGLQCIDIKFLKAHPNMTASKNQFMVIMDQSEVVTVRKVQFSFKKQGHLKLYPD